jgi:hypothetical protein
MDQSRTYSCSYQPPLDFTSFRSRTGPFGLRKNPIGNSKDANGGRCLATDDGPRAEFDRRENEACTEPGRSVEGASTPLSPDFSKATPTRAKPQSKNAGPKQVLVWTKAGPIFVLSLLVPRSFAMRVERERKGINVVMLPVSQITNVKSSLNK